MTDTRPLWAWDATEIARAIRLKQVSAREAVRAALDRCDQVNPKLNAVVRVLDAEALAAADAADAAIARGEAPGLLHGVPVTTKINVDQAGVPTDNGAIGFKDLPPATEDSAVVANFRKAGAIIIGRTNAPAFSLRWFTENGLHGRTLNPWNRDHTPGGSSGGASSAVAAGIGAIAHGNDLAGSVRYPAYCTGVAGIRPSHGRVPAFNPSQVGDRPLSAQMMSVQGPLARRVGDLRIALAAMSKGDARDPWWVPAPLEGPPPARPIRVAMSVDPAGLGVSTEVAAAVRQAGALLAEAGYAVEEADPPDMAGAVEDWLSWAGTDMPVFMAPVMAQYGDDDAKRCFDLFAGARPPLDKDGLMRLEARRSARQRAWALFLQRYPVLLLPPSGEVAFPYGLDLQGRPEMERIICAQAVSFAIPMIGLPGVSVPTGVTPAGLPMGVQIVAPRFREDLALDAAEAIEARCPMPTPIDPRW